jgi:hypothetical protein
MPEPTGTTMHNGHRREIPLFPLGTVLFPGGRLPLRIFEDRYLRLIRACVRDGSTFGICLIQDGREVGATAMPVDVGCLASIVECTEPEPGLLHVITEGGARFRILTTRADPDGLLHGDVVMLDPEPTMPVRDEHFLCTEILRRLVERAGDEWFPPPHTFDDATWVGYRLAEALPLDPMEKQRLLVTNDPRARLDRMLQVIRRG